MRKTIALILSLTFTGVLLASELAFSAEKFNGATGKNIIKRPVSGGTTVMGDAPVSLTSEECTKLGGTINAYQGACKSGQACQRTDEDGVSHSVCITKLK